MTPRQAAQDPQMRFAVASMVRGLANPGQPEEFMDRLREKLLSELGLK